MGEIQIQYRRLGMPSSEVAEPFEETSASLNDGRRSDVAVVADDQEPIDTPLASDLDGLPKHLSGVPPTPEGGQDTIANVPTFTGQPLVELEADGNPPD